MQVTPSMSVNEILKAAHRLDSPELEQLVSQVIVLQAQRRAPSLPQKEAELLRKINQGLPADIQARYDHLIAKRRSESLSDDEYRELLQLTELAENHDVRRIEYLAELADLRRQPLIALMDELGIHPPDYA